MTRVAVLGAGEVAAQIGCEYALGGCSVLWPAAEEQSTRQHVEGVLRMASQHGLAGPAQLERARALMAYGEDLSGDRRLTLIMAALGCDLQIEADAIRPLAETHPEALVATVNAAISVTELASAAGTGRRTLAMVYGDPPLLSALVEIVAAQETPTRLLDRAAQLLRAIGKRPVMLRREVPGLLSGRLETALLRECLWLVEAGIATPEAIDTVVRDRLAGRLRLLGPLEAAERRGAAQVMALLTAVAPAPALGSPEAVLDSLPALGEGRSEAEIERRDSALAAELRAERAVERED